MASTKENSSSQTSYQGRLTKFTENKEVRQLTSPLNALPLPRDQSKEAKKKEHKENDKKNLKQRYCNHRDAKNSSSKHLSSSDYLKCKKESSSKKNRVKDVISPHKFTQTSTTANSSHAKSISPVKETNKSVTTKIIEEIKPPPKNDKTKKESGAKEKQNNIYPKQQMQKNNNENCSSTIRQQSKDENYNRNLNIEKVNTHTLLHRPTDVHNKTMNTSPSQSKNINEEKEGNELQENKEKDELKNKKLSPDIQTKLSVLISKTIQQKKIFAMGCSNFSTIKNAMLKRGWIQKFGCEESSLKTGVPPSNPEGAFTHRMLRMVPINFIWVYTVTDWNDIKPQTLVNRFPRASASHSITTKLGLNYNLQQSHWFYESGISCVKFPRTYSILSQEDLYDFIDEYIMTACTSLLKLVVRSVIRVEHDLLRDGDIPQETIYFAINRCNDYIAFREHKDIDSLIIGSPSKQTAKEFLKDFYKIVHEGATFETASHNDVQGAYLSAKSALHGIQRFRRQTNLDGYKNLWVLKQSNLNCGKGIQLLSTLDEIVDAVGEIKNPRFVIQKYIERPLLIYDTKFDIRQWILLTSVNPLHIWMYNECYFRFSSQEFSLCDISESVHLCNNCIQRKYKNGKRHPNLPSDNMWDSNTFHKYLVDIGESDKWDSVIYPGMKECIIGTLMAAQEDMIDRVNSFELYGVDFMLTEDFTPWLIEINASPAMGPTTSVTSRMCSQCLNDVIKVVVDRRANPKADTGQFTLIYKQETTIITKSLPLDFAIIGKKIMLGYKPYRYHSAQRPPIIIDLPKTNIGKEFCIKDSPSTCVLPVLIQKKSWVSDIRVNDKRRKRDNSKSGMVLKSTKEDKSVKQGDVKDKISQSNATEFIKSTILNDLIHKTCLITSYNEAQKMADSSRDIRNIKKELINDKHSNEIKIQTKSDIKDKNCDVIKGTASSTGNNTIIKNINKDKNSVVIKNINKEKYDLIKQFNDEPLNNINVAKNNEVHRKNYMTRTINTVKDNEAPNNSHIINIVKDNEAPNNSNIMQDSVCLDAKNKDVIQVNVNKTNLKEINEIYETGNCKTASLKKDEGFNSRKPDKLTNVSKNYDVVEAKVENDSVTVNKDKNRERMNEEESLNSYATSSKSKQNLRLTDILSKLKNSAYYTVREEKLDRILKEPPNISNFSKQPDTNKIEEEEKAIKYTIYYNKDKTHFIVDVVESNRKKGNADSNRKLS